MSNAIVTREWNGKTLTFREDGYFNMTKAAKQFGKRLQNFFDNQETRDYCFELSQSLPDVIDWDSSDLTYGLTFANRGRYGGTWAHPKLAVFFARWLDVRFAVACDQIIDDILRGKSQVVPAQPAQPQVPQTMAQALRLAADQAEQIEQLESDNKEMSDELNFVTINEYIALDHRYMDRGTKSLLGRAASKMAKQKGIELDHQERTVSVSV